MTETKLKPKDEDMITSSFWEPKVGDELIGKLRNVRLSKWGKDLYDIDTDKGMVTIKSSVVLSGVIGKEMLDRKLRIKYLGFKMGKGTNKYRDYEVYLID